MNLEDTATVYFKQPKDNYPKYLLSIKPTNTASCIKPMPLQQVQDCEKQLSVTPAEIAQVMEWSKETSKMMLGVTVTGTRKMPTQLAEEKICVRPGLVHFLMKEGVLILLMITPTWAWEM
jgi:hypothetical protein